MSSFYVYFHYEEEPDFTLKVQVDSNKSLTAYIEHFVNEYNFTFSGIRKLNKDIITLVDDRKKSYPINKTIKQFLKVKGDVFVVEKPKKIENDNKPQNSSNNNQISENIIIKNEKNEEKSNIELKSNEKTSISSGPPQKSSQDSNISSNIEKKENSPEKQEKQEKIEIISAERKTLANDEFKEKGDRLKNEGNDYLQKGDNESAIIAYTSAISFQPQNPILFSNRSQAYLNVHKDEEALEDAIKSIELDNTFPKAHFRAGKASFNLFRFEEGKRYFQNGISAIEKGIPNASLKKEFQIWIKKCESARNDPNIQKQKQLKMIEKMSQSKENNLADMKKIAEKQQNNSFESKIGKETSLDEASKQIYQYIEAGKKFFTQGKLREAKKVFEGILEVVPAEKISIHHLSAIYSNSRHYKQAADLLEIATKNHDKEVELFISYGDALHHLKKYEKAIEAFSAAAKLAEKDEEQLDRINVLIGRTLMAHGQKDLGFQFVASVLKKNENNTAGLLEYAKALLERGIIQESLRVLLRLIVLKTENKSVKNYFARAVEKENGISLLKAELNDASYSSPALAFIALILKDHGAIKEASSLFKEASFHSPTNSSYALNYAHNLEIEFLYSDAFNFLLNFFNNNPSLSVKYNDESKETVKNADILNALSNKSFAEITPNLKNISPETEIFLEGNSEKNLCKENLQISSKNEEKNENNNEKNNEKNERNRLTEEEKDLLAIYFTITKILFLNGALAVVSKVIEVVEKARAGRELHTTSIRNEHAYYCCIKQLLGFYKPPVKLFTPFYVVGDSHSLPLSFHSFSLQNKERTFIPKLVTGCKMWHLRDESIFFPKYNFWNAVNTLPNGSDVLMIFGEIDCREGILLAIEKCVYENFEEGAEHTIDIYLSVLKKLHQKKNLNLFIHPILPVLNETRANVKKFNRILEEKVKKIEYLHWLNFFDELLVNEGNDLNPQFVLDGTHISPLYLPLVTREISSHF